MVSSKWIAICILLAVLRMPESGGKIHRAMSPSPKGKGKNGVSQSSDLEEMSNPWLYAVPATLLVGMTGIFPLLVIPVEAGHKLREGVSADRLKLLLSFAVGGLLGDVFLHLLPEAYGPIKEETANQEHLKIGLWIIGGMLTFLVLEKMFQESDEKGESDKKIESHYCEQNGDSCNGSADKTNGHVTQNGFSDLRKRVKESTSENSEQNKEYSKMGDHTKLENAKDGVKVIGYLNLLANCIDNFTHGLAVSGSFLVSTKVGLLTTFAIILHEIPHEIGDFAILLKSGFRRWDAACGQILTATGGLVGAVFGLVVAEPGDSTCWILPFTSGGFIYISLVTIVPELLEENRPWESFKQVVFLIIGTAAMGLVSLIH